MKHMVFIACSMARSKEETVGWLFGRSSTPTKDSSLLNCHFNATFHPSRACLLLACLIVQNNHPTINSSMPKEETAFSPLESLATVLRKLFAKVFASERVLWRSAIRRQIQFLFAATCLNQNVQNLSSLSHSFQIAIMRCRRMQFYCITMTFNVVNQECIVFAWWACMSDEMHPNCDRISPLSVISWAKMAD